MNTPELSYREIPLTQGVVALVDAVDYENLVVYKWRAQWNRATKSFYAARSTYQKDGKRGIVLMHRQILGLECGDKREGDHGQHNTLDNRRFVDGKPNLRVATRFQNVWNVGKTIRNSSGFKGVSLYKRDGTFVARITFQGKEKHLGYYLTPEEAHAAYCEAASHLHGEFARVS